MIQDFCDPDGSMYKNSQNNRAQIILNKGGQTLNLLYILDDNGSNGYWILLDNNFDFI